MVGSGWSKTKSGDASGDAQESPNRRESVKTNEKSSDAVSSPRSKATGGTNSGGGGGGNPGSGRKRKSASARGEVDVASGAPTSTSMREASSSVGTLGSTKKKSKAGAEETTEDRCDGDGCGNQQKRSPSSPSISDGGGGCGNDGGGEGGGGESPQSATDHLEKKHSTRRQSRASFSASPAAAAPADGDGGGGSGGGAGAGADSDAGNGGGGVGVGGGVAGVSSDPSYDRCWSRLLAMTSAQCEKSEIAAAYGCEAVRRSVGGGGGGIGKHWAAICGGNTIGMYDTKEEAIKRAICAAMVWAESAGGGMANFEPKPSSLSGQRSPPSKAVTDRSSTPDARMPSTIKTKSADGSSSTMATVRGEDADPASPSVAQPTASVPPASKLAGNASAARLRKPSTTTTANTSSSPRPKSVEMSDVSTRKVIQIFRSSAQASKVTQLSRVEIAKACKDGGGQVEGKFFRFVYLDRKGDTSRPSSLPVDAAAPSITTTTIKKKSNESKVEASAPLFMRATTAEAEAGSSAAVQDAMDAADDEDEMVDVVGDGDAIKPRPNDTTESNENGPRSIGHVLLSDAAAEEATKIADADKTKRNSALDFTTLIRPLKSSSTRFKKYIELIDPDTDKVLVCFRGSNDAHDALGHRYDKKLIIKACAAEKEFEMKKNDGSGVWPLTKPYATVFGTFRMRYARSDRPPSAYVFGAHEEDFCPFPEGMTHDAIKKRWSEVYVSERRAAELGIEVQVGVLSTGNSNPAAGDSGEGVEEDCSNKNDTTPSTSQAITIGGSPAPPRRVLQKFRTGPTSEELPLRSVGLGTGGAGSHGAAHSHAAAMAAFGGGRTLVTVRRPPLDADDMACVVCQEASARIVFEPCHHCVLCVSCSESGHCQRFCPHCRAQIKGRMQPTFVRLIRPRVYSAQSFM